MSGGIQPYPYEWEVKKEEKGRREEERRGMP
jgi:hypothetical protein